MTCEFTEVMFDKTKVQPPRQCRVRFTEEQLDFLLADIRQNGLINRIELLPCGELISGYHRWLAMMKAPEITDIPARIITDPISALELRGRRCSENLQRVNLSFWDKYLEVSGFFADSPGITGKEVAKILSVDESTITRYLCPDRCIEEVRQAAKEGRIGLKACYEISKAKPERQAALLAKALGGTAAEVAEAGTPDNDEANGTVQSEDGPGTKPGGFTIPLTADKAVTLKGADSFDAAIELLGKAVSDIKAAKATKDLDFKLYKLALRRRLKPADTAKTAAAVVEV